MSLKRSISAQRRRLLALGALGLGGLLLPMAAQANETKPEKNERHPHIHAAIRELRDAAHYLKTAAHDFGGHREKALELIHKTITQLELCLKQ